MTLATNGSQQNDIEHTSVVCHYAVCRDYLNVMLSVVLLNFVTLSAVMLNVVMLSAVMLNVFMLSAVMLSVIMLIVFMLSVFIC
jgi:hypothetical protein